MNKKPHTWKHNSWVDDFTIDQLGRIRPSHYE